MNAPRPLQSPSAQMPGDIRRQTVVDGDVAAIVGRTPARPVPGRRCSAGGPRRAARASRLPRPPCAHSPTPPRRPRAARERCTRRRSHRDAFCLQDSVTARETSSSSRAISRGLLDDRDLRAESPVHLRKFEPDVAAADDDQMPRHTVERQHRGVREIRHVVHAGQVRHDARRRR